MNCKLALYMEQPNYFDIHAHLHFSSYDKDRGDVLRRLKESGVWSLEVGVDLESSKKAVGLAGAHKHIFATVGLHPSDKHKEAFDISEYETLVQNENIVAIGECGLDYFRLRENIEGEKKRQRKVFQKQIQLALAHDLPLMLHCRPSKGSMDAYEDVLEMLSDFSKEAGSKLRGNVHFFVGDIEIAKQFLDLGFTFSFTGVITFARDYDEVIKFLPLERIMSETDSPFVAPEPHRGKRNEPLHVREVVEKIAEIRGEEKEKIKTALVSNTLRTFKIKPELH